MFPRTVNTCKCIVIRSSVTIPEVVCRFRYPVLGYFRVAFVKVNYRGVGGGTTLGATEFIRLLEDGIYYSDPPTRQLTLRT